VGCLAEKEPTVPHVVTRPGLVAGARIAALLAVVHAANDVLMAFVGVLLPSIRSTFDASPTALAVLVAVFTVSASATQPIIGTVAERLGLRRVLAVGVALGAVAMSLLGVAPRLGVLVLLLAVGGLGSAALHPAAMSVVGSPAAVNPGLAVGLFTAGGMVGFALGPALLLWFVRGYGLEQSYWLMLPGLVAAALLWWGLPDWEPHTPNPRSGWQALMNAAPRLRWPLVVSVLVNLAFVTVTSTVPLWLVDSHGVATEGALLGWVLGAFSVAAGAGAVLGGALGGRLGYRTTGVVSLLLAAPVLVVLVVVPVGAWTLAAAALLGGLSYVSQPLLVVRAQQLVPAAPVAATGVVVGLGTGIAGGLYVAVGAVQELIGLRNSLLLTSLLLAAAAAAAYRALPGKGAAPAPEAS
jgi:FSR family fosmidomycin resistance protein-like MFS transporter